MQNTLRKIQLATLLLLVSVNFSFTSYFAAPTFNGSSVINNTTGTQFTLRVNADQAGTLYYVVNTTDTNPSATEVKAGQIGGGGAAPISGSFAITAATNADQVISGLTAGTGYFINFIAENGGAEQSAVQEISATATDATAPTISSSSVINNTTGTSFSIRVNANENSTVYYVVTTSSTVPTAAQVVAGQDHTSAAAFKSGNAAATAGVDLDQAISGLTNSTLYYVYSVARDASNNNSTVDQESATTTDSTAPTISSSSIINNNTGTSFSIRVNANENATIYYVVTTSATVPSAAQVIAGQNHLGAAALKSGNAAGTAGVDLDQAITGLTNGTLYHVYSVARDASNNNSTVDAESATTTDTTAPTYNSSSVINIASTSFTLRVNVNENSTVYYVVTTSTTVPSAAQILAGQDHTSAAAFKSGNAAATAAADLDQNITGLATSTTYYVYSIARDASNNNSTVDQESAATICTPADVTALKVSDTNTTARLYWTDPGCFDEFLIVAKQGTASVAPAISGTPTGDGTAYTANASFTGGGTAFDGGKVVFKSGTNPGAGGFQITNLTQGLIYSFKIYTRKGTSWSSGNAIRTVPGPPVVLSFDPVDGATGVPTDQVFTITFNEKVYISSTGASGTEDDIEFDQSGGNPTIARGSGDISLNTYAASFFVSGDLDINEANDILIGNKVFADSTGNNYGGTSSGNWNITTAAGVSITAPAIGACSGQYSGLGDIVLTEAADNNFQGTDNGSFTLIIGFDAASGFAFKPGVTGVTATPAPGGDIQSITVNSVSFSQVSLTIQFKNVSNDGQAKDDPDVVTISGLKVTTDGSVAPPTTLEVKAASTMVIQGIVEDATTLATINGGSVPAAPTVSWPSADNSYCSTTDLSTINITASGGTSYNWYSDPGLTTVLFTNQTTRTAAQVFGASPGVGIHTRYVTNVNGCESTATPVTLVITAPPTANAGNGATVCPGESISLGGSPTGTGGTGSYTYSWVASPVGFTSSTSNPTLAAPANGGGSNTDYTYTVTVTDNNGCSDNDNVVYTVKTTAENVIFTEPNTFFYTTNNNPINLEGSPDGGFFSGVGVSQLDTAFQFDPELAGIGTWPVTYTTTLANGCTKSVVQNFEVTTPYDVFPDLQAEYCNNENPVSLTISQAILDEIANYINTWNTVYVPNYNYAPLKPTFTGIIRNEYEVYYGDNNSVVGSTFYPSALLTDQAYPAAGGIYGACATCNYVYISIYLEFASPLNTYPYNYPSGDDRGWFFNNGTTAAFSYRGEFVAVNPVPVVSFAGLANNYCQIDTDYTLTGNKTGGFFEIANTNNPADFDNQGNPDPEDGIQDITDEPTLAGGIGVFNPLDAYGSAASAVTKYIRYSVDPGTTGSTGQGCVGRHILPTVIYPSTPITFRATAGTSNPPADTQFCYEGASVDLSVETVSGGTDLTSNVSFTGFGVSDNGAGVGKFTPKTAFDQKNPSSNSLEDMLVTATHVNSQGCTSVTTRNYKVRPKPASFFEVKDLSDNVPPDNNFCYNEGELNLTGSIVAGNTGKYIIDYLNLSHSEDINATNMVFDPSIYFDNAVAQGGSLVSDATFNVTYQVTDPIGCTASSTKLFAVSPLAAITISGINNGDKFCSNSTPFPITFAPINGTLKVNGGIISLNPATNSIFSTSLPIGNAVTIAYEYKSGVSQCVTNLEYTISKIDAPVASFNTTPVCDGDEATFTAAPDPNNYLWTWVLGDSVRSGTSNESIVHVFPGLSRGATQTSYLIKLIIENNDPLLTCKDSAEAIQVIGAYPEVDFSYSDVCQDDFTRFTISNNIPIVTAAWDFGDSYTLPNTALNTNIAGADTHGGRTQGKYGTPEHRYAYTPGQPNRYTAELIARTAPALGACSDTVTHQVAILESLAPTPNNPYTMAALNGGDGLWIEESRSDSATWEFAVPNNAPGGKSVINATEGTVWITGASTYKATDDSYMNSPCFDLTAFSKPVISMNYWSYSDPGKDGAILQFSTNGGATWQVVGTPTSGVNWYNNATIASSPGGFNQFGWTGRTQLQWLTGKNSLDAIPDLSNVRFRIAFASDEREEYDGFAFNQVIIEERNRIMLVEHFANDGAPGTAVSKSNFNTATQLTDVEVVRIQYQTSFPTADAINALNPIDNNARAAYYGITSQSVPVGFIDGGRDAAAQLGFMGTAPSAWWVDYKQKRSLSSAPYDTLKITMLPSVNNETINIQVTSTRIATVPGLKPVLFVALVSKSLSGNENVLRKFLPNAAGTPIDRTALTIDETFSWTPEGMTLAEIDDLAVVVFVQDELTKEVYQAWIEEDPTNLPTSVVTDADDEDYSSRIQLFPNPADEVVNVILPNAANKATPVTLSDSYGRAVYQNTIEAGKNQKAIETKDLRAGMYFLQIQTPQGGIARKKVLIVHD
jgi:hypothetical protein